MANILRDKCENLNYFLAECQNYVKAIEKYSGSDPLELWYQYLLWIDENFVIDFKRETIFEIILSACLSTFEKDERYKQDRRLIKLFIKFIHFQEEQDMHYETMLANGIGNKVADLYINWAFYFDMKDDFKKVDHIFRLGISERADPIDLLLKAHRNFGYTMSQRILYKSNDVKRQEHLERMQTHLGMISALRIDGTSSTISKSIALHAFDMDKLVNVCIPFNLIQTSVAENQLNTSVTQNILDSARKMRREKRSKGNMTGCRLDFTDAAPETKHYSHGQTLYEKGIKVGKNYPRKSLPQREFPVKAYIDPDIGTYRKTMPGYDKIMLVPATNVAFSAEELKAYKWFKQRGIVNTFTTEQDKIWGNGYDVPIRWADVFARSNFPQSEQIFPRISPLEYFNETGPHKFVANMTKLYPKNLNEEFQLEEIMWQKRKLAANRSTTDTIQFNRSLFPNRVHSHTNSTDSKLSPIIEMDLSVYDEALTKVPDKEEKNIRPNLGLVETKKRKSSIFPAFDALNDTCTTQMFGNLLRSTAISTPKVKMAKFDVESAHGQLPEETKLKLFTDQSTSNSMTDQTDKKRNNVMTDPENDFKFAIYEDTTIMTRDLKAVVCQNTNNSTIGNKENLFVPKLERSKMSGDVNKTENKRPNVTAPNDQKKDENIVKVSKDVTKETQNRPAFVFDIYTDKTYDIQKTLENAHQTTTDSGATIVDKENIAHANTITKNSVAKQAEQVRDMIKSVLNATKCKSMTNDQSALTDKTNENIQKSMDNSSKVHKCPELSITNKEDKENANEHQNKINSTKTPLEREIAKMTELITSVLNATKAEKSATNDQLVFKEPSMMNLSVKKTDPAKKSNQTTFFELLDTTEEFEALEAQCESPPVQAISATPTKKIDESSAKIWTPNKSTANQSARDKTLLNWTLHRSIAMTKDLSMIECIENFNEDNDEISPDNDVGRSIYVKQSELKFDEEDANWNEVTQFLADGAVKNEYKVLEVNLNETRQRIDTHMLNLRDLNPFDPEVQKDVLTDIGFLEQLNGANNFNCVMMNIVHPLKPRSSIEIDKRKFQVRKLIGTGAFGKVFSAECTKTKEWYALKQLRPPNIWEYYVCLQIHTRILDESIRKGFMAVDFAVIGNNATIYASKFAKYGTILNVCNKVKQTTNKSIDECIVMLLVKQMFTIVENFHKANFIHADIKPDNFLLMDKLSLDFENPEIVLQLIDFGQSIDLSYFSNHVFWTKVKTENFICTQMMEDKPWTYHCDLFCLASTIYTMVAGKYMVVSRPTPNEPYKPQKLPRYVNATLWDDIFHTLINIPSLQKMPSLARLQGLIDVELKAIGAKKLTESIIKFNKALD